MTLPAGTTERERVKLYSTAVTWTRGTTGGPPPVGDSPGGEGLVDVPDPEGALGPNRPGTDGGAVVVGLLAGLEPWKRWRQCAEARRGREAW